MHASSPGKRSKKYKVWERAKQLANNHPKSKTHTHVFLIPNCEYPFMKWLKATKKYYFIKPSEITHFSRLHTVTEEDVLMSSIRAGK